MSGSKHSDINKLQEEQRNDKLHRSWTALQINVVMYWEENSKHDKITGMFKLMKMIDSPPGLLKYCFTPSITVLCTHFLIAWDARP